MLQISELYIYPIKSLPGIKVNSVLVTPTGFEYDRRWMLVDENNLFISQREAPQMTQLLVSLETNGLKVTNKINGEFLILPFTASPSKGRKARTHVVVWDDTCYAEFVSDEADIWFSSMLGFKCRLVYMPDDARRMVDQTYAPGDVITSFSDGYPFLLIGQASLDDLNSRLAVPLPMDRFRPNIVFATGEPYEEDLLGNFTIGSISFKGVKLCARCPIPTINQQDGTRGKEPLKTLASYRQKNNKVLFGQNLIHYGEGAIKVGDKLKVLSYNNDERFIVNIPAEKI
ncbi:MOSC N-terminal beta barrel domain-containing protein [uncultured Mucilaginibacter sp.]|uniref:MOSC domain-containing protein n=1 Tax=uncultured Mucilaginibacter sp. TaxID=797541 RepID=UPI0025F8AD11|nr:MOSC N-terminal beta barrel domain-containing protein [uncultured Mucilaginibacter sp.]